MSIVPKDSVRFHVALAVVVTIVLSWVLSTGLANYLSYRNIIAQRQEMLAHPGQYPEAIPAPQFTVTDFLLGRPPRSGETTPAGPAQPPQRRRPPQQWAPAEPPFPRGPAATPANPNPAGGRGPRAAPPPKLLSPLEWKWVLLRLGVALALAGLAAAWIGRKLTRPLAQLVAGARAYHTRDFGYRIPVQGQSEFTAVATAMNEMAQEVDRHIRRLEEDTELRRRFLADVAHELRSPVTTLRTMAGALQDGVAADPERKARAISVLVRTSERMLRLIQDVMDLVEQDLDRLPVTQSEVDLRGLVGSAMAAHEAAAAKAGLTFEASRPGAPVTARVDPDRMAQVLDNILENAISYAGAGACVNADVEDGDPVRITIRDTGVGIPAKDLPHILDPFYRVQAARSPGESHFGLGMSIARRLVEAQGGRLSVESQEGHGTTVTILIRKAIS